MRGRHSIEIKNMLEQNSRRRKTHDPDSDSNLTTYSNNNSNTLKNSDSTSTLHASQSEISLIQERYQTLKEDFHLLLNQTHSRVSLFKKQKEQLEKQRTRHLKTQKEIERLKSLLNIAKKGQVAPMTTSVYALSQSRIGKRQKNCSSLPKERTTPLPHPKTPLMNRQSIVGKEGSGLRKIGTRQRQKGQFAKYKFMPSVVQ